jgi:hypothetical protein
VLELKERKHAFDETQKLSASDTKLLSIEREREREFQTLETTVFNYSNFRPLISIWYEGRDLPLEIR